MVLETLGLPFDGSIRYWIESSYGTASLSTGTLPVSCKVQDVRIDTGDRHRVLRDIGSPILCGFAEQTTEPKLHLEYIPQTDDTLIDDVIDRIGSCCTLQSFTFGIGFNKCSTASLDNTSWFKVTGAKPQTVRISGSKGADYLVTIDFECQSITTVLWAAAPASYIHGEGMTNLVGEYCIFNVAGDITKVGGHVVNANRIAFITKSIDITVNHNLQGLTDCDDLKKTYLLEGAMDIEGSVDITLDGGGAQHFQEVMDRSWFQITLDLADAAAGGYPRITLPSCQWKSTSLDKNISSEAMSSSVPFDCKASSCSTIVSQPTV